MTGHEGWVNQSLGNAGVFFMKTENRPRRWPAGCEWNQTHQFVVCLVLPVG
jgi:hypothetical protein